MMETIRYCLFDFWEVEGDPRVSEYPLFRGGPWVGWSIIAFYVYFVTKLGPTLMKNREPFSLRGPIIAYNTMMIALNAYFVYEMMINYRLGIDMNMYTFVRLPTNDFSPRTLHIIRLSFVFLLSKYLDLIETIFFVLRKKQNQISTLHVYHHSVVPVLVHLFAKLSPSGGPGVAFPFLNCTIHMVMYTYYTMAALGLHRYLWWKRYLTQMQLGQFVLFGVYGAFFYRHQQGYPPIFNYLGVMQPAIFFYLFYTFYRSSYKQKQQQQQQLQQKQQQIQQQFQQKAQKQAIVDGADKTH